MSRFFNLVLVVNILLAILICVRLWDPLPVQVIRTSLFDLYQRISPRAVEKLPVTVVDIDEKSLQEIGQWPWPRTMLVQMLENLSAADPLVIGFDTVFAEADRLSPVNMVKQLTKQIDSDALSSLKLKDSDELFAKSISMQSVVLGTMLTPSQNQDAQIGKAKTQFRWTSDPAPFIPTIQARAANLEILESAASGVGILTLLPEPDGVVRRVPTLFRIGQTTWPSFGVEIMRIALAERNVTVNVDKAGIDSLSIGGITIPTNAKGLTWVHYNAHQQQRFISAADVLLDRVNYEEISGHIILIGASASGLHDIKMTPMAQQMSGVEIWAQWLESGLFGQLLKRPNFIFISELIFVFLFGQLLIFLTFRARAKTSLYIFISSILVCGFFSWWLYTNKSQLFDFSFPLISAGLLFAFLMYMKFYKEEQQRRQIRNAFGHYLSPSIVDEIARHPKKLKLGGEVRDITSLFTDLEGFTMLSETFEAENLVDLINQYLDGICQIIIKHEGTVDKIIGDAVHAIFGAPQYSDQHAEQAIDCALAIDAFSVDFIQQQLEKGYKLGATRIGVNSGQAVVGNFGGQVRFDYTAYGDAVNTASRLESANQVLGTRICVSKATVDLCQHHLFRPIGLLSVKGKSDQVMVFEPVRKEAKCVSYLDKYKRAFASLEQKEFEATQLFNRLHDEFPDDAVINVHLEYIKKGNLSIQRDIFNETH